MYKQGDIIAVHYPLTDKPAKTKLRPAIVVSNNISNKLDNDILVCPITPKTHDSEFSYPLSEVCNFGLICPYRIKDNFSYF
jgi:mRNA-degrading endonuclease toxin of MazEF toxin-antitoxin module